MEAIFIVAIVFGFLAVVVLTPVIIVWLVIRAIGSRSKSSSITPAELQLVQEIYTSLAEMEKRIEALETILLGKME